MSGKAERYGRQGAGLDQLHPTVFCGWVCCAKASQ